MTNFTPEFAAGPNFQEQIDAIAAGILTPENIDTYADDALTALVGVVTDATEQYRTFPTVCYETGIEEERAALAYFGLDEGSVEATLDHISEQAETIRNLDGIIERITVHTRRIITPPASRRGLVTPGTRHLKPSRHVPRLKTLLFVANKAFDIDLEDQAQCKIIEGEVNPDAMREVSYKLVVLPTINRAVLVCDQERNATFVFDTDLLAGAQIDEKRLQNMTKDDIRGFLEANPTAGYWLRYSNHYTENVASLLNAIPPRQAPIPVDEDGARFLWAGNRAPRGLFSLRDVAREFGATPHTAEQAIVALGDELGEVAAHTFGNGSTGPVLTEDQKARVGVWLDANKYLVEKVTDDDSTTNKMVQEFHVAWGVIKEAVAALGGELGAPTRKRVGNGYADVYSASQKAMIRVQLVKQNKVHADPNMRMLTAEQLGPVAGLSGVTVRKILGAHAVQLGLEEVGSKRYMPESHLGAFRALLAELGYTLPEPPVDPL
jgi:hypothetical protein